MYSLIILSSLFFLLITIFVIVIYKKKKETYTPSQNCNEGDFLISTLSLCVDNENQKVVFTLDNPVKDTTFCFSKFDLQYKNSQTNCSQTDAIPETTCSTSSDSIIVDFSNTSFPSSDFSNKSFCLIARNFCAGDTSDPYPYKLLIKYENLISNSDNLFMYDTDKPSDGFSQLLNPAVAFTDNLKNYMCNTFNTFYNGSDSDVIFYIGRTAPKNNCS